MYTMEDRHLITTKGVSFIIKYGRIWTPVEGINLI